MSLNLSFTLVTYSGLKNLILWKRYVSLLSQLFAIINLPCVSTKLDFNLIFTMQACKELQDIQDYLRLSEHLANGRD